MKHIILIAIFFSSLLVSGFQKLEVNELPPLPDETGFNGSFIGVTGNYVIVAGGANFPDTPVWDGGIKVWYDDIYVLEKSENGYRWLTDPNWKLPRKIGYGVAVEALGGIVCMGGSNGDGVYNDVFLLKFDGKKIIIEELPPLPYPMSAMDGDILSNKIYLTGGFQSNDGPATARFCVLDLNKYNSSGFGWQELDTFPGPARINPVVVSQNDGKSDKLFVLSGRDFNTDKENPHKLHSDAYSYNPLNEKWRKLGDIPSNNTFGKKRGFIGAAPAVAVGGSHILIFGGAGGENQKLLQNMELQKEIDVSADEAVKDSLESVIRQNIIDTRFSQTVLAYHTITDTWLKIGEFDKPSQAVTRAVKLDGNIIISGGEIGPGVRTTQTIELKVLSEKKNFGVVNYLTLGGYLLLIVWIGWYYSSKTKTSQSYFLGSGKIPWWAVGLSIYATQLSAITYLALPALAFSYDWQTYLGFSGIIMVVPIITKYYLPKYRQFNITSIYEYLEQRFDLAIRMVGSISFIMFQLARMGIVVYLPALALSAVLGVNIHLAIAIMGVLAITYTYLGGIEAVIWTDVLQSFILLAGLVISIIFIVADSESISGVFQTAFQDDKFRILDLRLSTSEVVTWSLFLGSFALNFAPYTTDQTVVQRYLTTKNVKETGKSMWLNGLLSLPAGALIFLTGTFLYVFYKGNPDLLQIGMENDKIFAHFIANELPAGVSGLLIAGIFSATMSSLDSSMHSVATVISVDFVGRFTKKRGDSKTLQNARYYIIIIGILGTAIASYMAMSPVQSLFFLFQEVLGLMGSALSGIFIIGIFTKNVRSGHVLVGTALSIMSVVWLKYMTDVHFYVYPLIGIPVCVITSLLLSKIINPKK